VKKLLRSTLAKKTLTFEEFYTVLAEVDACLNSRPLNQLTSNLAIFVVLTPGHFLIGRPLTAPPKKIANTLKVREEQMAAK
jgi:hypothetical protein